MKRRGSKQAERIEVSPESYELIRSYPHAARRRYAEAVALSEARLYPGAIYLIAYACEMMIRYLSYRLEGWATTKKIYKEDRDRLAKKAAATQVTVSNHHDFVGLALHIESQPCTELERPLRRLLRSKAQVIGERWDPSMRYRSTDRSAEEFREVRDAVDWIQSNYGRILNPGRRE
jgi:hypothetical protein